MPAYDLSVAQSSRDTCISCGAKENTSNVTLSKSCDIFERLGIVVKVGYQCICDGCEPKPIESLDILSKSTNNWPKKSVSRLLKEMRKRRQRFRGIDGVTDPEFQYLTKLSKDQFIALQERASITEALKLMIFLMICNLDISQRFCGILFSLSQSTISNYFQSALLKLNSISRSLLGLKNISVDSIKTQHTTKLFRTLFPKVRLVGDGTYIYIQKSSNFQIQKDSYSSHKGRNLVKFLIFCAPDGYFVECLGPFYSNGKHNDEWLFNVNYAKQNSPLREYLDPNEDEVMLDRGFLRIDSELKFHAPKPLSKGNAQLSTQDANYSRKVTRLRNVIERAFGRLKHWKILSNVLENSYVNSIGDIVCVLCSISNMFFSPLFMDLDSDDNDIQILMRGAHHQDNPVRLFISSETESRTWKTIASERFVSLFPPIRSLDSIRDWNIGDYGVDLSGQYLESLKNLKFSQSNEDSRYVRVAGIKSRFVQKKHHRCYFYLPEHREFQRVKAYCSCKSGARTVGGCSHCVCVLVFVFYGQRDQVIPNPNPVSEQRFARVTNVEEERETLRKRQRR